MNEVYYTDLQIAKRYGVSRQTIWRWIKSDESFPKSIKLSAGSTRWKESEIIEWKRKKDLMDMAEKIVKEKIKTSDISLNEADNKLDNIGSNLIGSFFHSIEDKHINWQGHVVSSPETGYYLCQLFSWLDGRPNLKRLVHISEMKEWLFYESTDQMIWEYQHGYASTIK